MRRGAKLIAVSTVMIGVWIDRAATDHAWALSIWAILVSSIQKRDAIYFFDHTMPRQPSEVTHFVEEKMCGRLILTLPCVE